MTSDDKQHIKRLLGTMTDSEIAYIAGISASWVGKLRRSLGIRPYRLHANPRKTCISHQEYLHMLSNHPEGITERQVVELMGVTRGAAYQMLCSLVAKGYATCVVEKECIAQFQIYKMRKLYYPSSSLLAREK